MGKPYCSLPSQPHQVINMIISAGIILIKDGSILLLRNRKGHIDFPKGHVEEGESILEAAIREFKEETGLSDKDIYIIPGKEYVMEYPVLEKGEIQNKRVILFLAKYVGKGEVKISKEHSEYKWAPLDEKLERELKYREQKNIIKQLLKDIQEIK